MPGRDDPTRASRPPLTVSIERRRLWQWMLLPAAQLVSPLAWAQSANVASTRLWPSQDYTRLIVESGAPLSYNVQVLREPERFVLDIDGVEASSEILELPTRVQASDPYVQSIRVGKRPAGGMRIVLMLKGPLKPDVFALPPVSEYGHRLVLDLYPIVPLDPLMALLEAEAKKDKKAAAAPPAPVQPESPPARGGERKITIAIDPGHGGEDPGAIGRRGTYEKNVTLAIARMLKARIDADRGMRAMLTRDDDYFVPLARTGPEGAARAGGPLRLHPCRRLPGAGRARLVGLRALRLGRHQRGGPMARAAREPRRPDRRRRSRPPRPHARAHAARPLADRADQRQPEGRPSRARRVLRA